MNTKSKAFRYTFILGVIGLLVSLSVGLIENRIIRSYKENLTRESLGYKVQSRVGQANVALSQLVMGDSKLNFENDVLNPYKTSKGVLTGILNGEQTELGSLEITGDEIAEGLINSAINDLSKLETAASAFWTNHKAGNSDSGTGNLLKSAQAASQSTIQSLVEYLNSGIASNLNVLQQWSWASVALVLVVFVILCLRLYQMQSKNDKLTEDNRQQLERETQRVESMSSFIEAVSAGNYAVELQGAGGDDDLTNKLLNMRNKLKENAEEDSKRNWSTSGLAQIGDILRANTASVIELYDNIIRFVVKYTQSNQGGMFLINDDDEHENFLELVACYAFERKKFLVKKVGKGEGLVGQCFLEGERILMLKVPEEYVSITSGLGGSNPNCLLLVPMKVNEKVYGVIEIATFKKYEEHEIELVEKFAESIASTISTVRTNESTKMLLEKSQQQAEEMKAQEEEMRQNMEELSATQEEMSRKNVEVERMLSDSSGKENELKEKLAEVASMKATEEAKSKDRITFMENYRKTLVGILDQLPHEIFLKDQDGRMVIVNTGVAKAHKKTPEELIGKSDFDFVDAKTAQEWRNQELEIIKKGHETFTHTDNISGYPRTLRTVKQAFFIPHLNQTGLLGIQTDVTDLGK